MAADAPARAVDDFRAWEAAELPDWFKNKRAGSQSLIVNRWVPALMVGIPVLVLVAIVIYPTIWMFFHSLHNATMVSLARETYSFVGIGNFEQVITSGRFLNSIKNLGTYLLCGAVLEVILGTAIALMLYEVVKARWLKMLLLVILVIPMMLPPSQVGLIWQLMLTPHNGIVNDILLRLGIVDHRIEWFSTSLSIWSVTFTDLWQWTSLIILIVYSGRVALSPSIYEAAQVDGAPRWKTLWRITLPMLKEVIAIAFIIRFMDAYKYVDYIYVMTSGGPAESSELPVYIAYQRGIRDFEVGEAAAYAIIIFVFAAILTTLFLKYLKRVLKARGIA